MECFVLLNEKIKTSKIQANIYTISFTNAFHSAHLFPSHWRNEKMPLCHKDVTTNWNRRIECNTLNGKLTTRFIYLAKHFAHTYKFFLYPWKLWYTQLWLEAIFYVWFPVLFSTHFGWSTLSFTHVNWPTNW